MKGETAPKSSLASGVLAPKSAAEASATGTPGQRSDGAPALTLRAPSGMCAVGLQLDVVLDADTVDELELRLDEIDRVFLGGQDIGQQLARAEVAHRFAVDDGGAQIAEPF